MAGRTAKSSGSGKKRVGKARLSVTFLVVVGAFVGLGAGLGLASWHGPAPVKKTAKPESRASLAVLSDIPLRSPKAIAPEPESDPEAAPQSVSLAIEPPKVALPAPVVIEPLPVPAALTVPPPRKGLSDPPWMRYAVTAPDIKGRPMIAVIIDDMGVDRHRSAQSIAMPAPLTMSFLPYGRDLSKQVAAAQAAGHEIMLHVPMEPEGHDDPGPDVLKVNLDKAELLRRLRADFEAVDHFVGINNHMGSRFSANRAGMSVVMAELHERGLMWIDSKTSDKSVGTELATRMNVPHGERQVFLDHEEGADFVRAQLVKLENIARTKGYAVAIGHPRDATTQVLSKWLQEVEGRGFVLVPITAVVRSQQEAGVPNKTAALNVKHPL